MTMSNVTLALCATAGALALKQMCVHLLCIRSRLLSGVIDVPEFKTLKPMLKAGFLIRGRADTDEKCKAMFEQAERATATTGNNAQNEPFFLAAATAMLPFVENGTLPVVFMAAYVLTRCAHNYAFVADTQPMRAMAYSAGLFMNVGFALVAMTAALAAK